MEDKELTQVSKQSWLEEMLDEHFHCVLCGGKLHLQSHVDHFTQLVVEEARCLCCGVKTRQSQHRLQ